MHRLTLALVSGLKPIERQQLEAEHGDCLSILDFSQDRDGLAKAGPVVDIVYGNVRPFELPELTNLRWVHATWTGIDNLLYPEMIASDVTITCTKGGSASQIAEHAVSGVAYLARDFETHLRGRQSKTWPMPSQAILMEESTALIAGLGHIGQKIAQKLSALGVRVLGLSRSGSPVTHCEAVYTPQTFHPILPEVDFLVLALPTTPTTRKLFDRPTLSTLKPGAGIINVGRGTCLDEAALTELIQSGHLRGAVLDVTDPEPPSPSSPLWITPGILLTGHRSWQPSLPHPTQTGFAVFSRNLPHFFAGKLDQLEGLVDKTQGY